MVGCLVGVGILIAILVVALGCILVHRAIVVGESEARGILGVVTILLVSSFGGWLAAVRRARRS